MNYLLSMDGGGSKTAWLLTDLDGNTVAVYRSPSCSHLECGADEAVKRIKSGIDELLKLGNIPADELCGAAFGIPCFGEHPKIDVIMERELFAYLPECAVSVHNDVELGFAGSLCLEDGIHTVAGTGAITVGKNGIRPARSNGWHPDFSDEGSAFWLGMKTLGLFAKQSDGREAKGALYGIIKEELSLSNDNDVIVFYSAIPHGERGRIAALQLLLEKAADAGDESAKALFDEAVRELYASVCGVYRTLGFTEDKIVPVSYSGGLFNNTKYILEPFCKLVSALPVRVTAPCLSPLEGGILLAMENTAPEKVKDLSIRLKENSSK